MLQAYGLCSNIRPTCQQSLLPSKYLERELCSMTGHVHSACKKWHTVSLNLKFLVVTGPAPSQSVGFPEVKHQWIWGSQILSVRILYPQGVFHICPWPWLFPILSLLSTSRKRTCAYSLKKKKILKLEITSDKMLKSSPPCPVPNKLPLLFILSLRKLPQPFFYSLKMKR